MILVIRRKVRTAPDELDAKESSNVSEQQYLSTVTDFVVYLWDVPLHYLFIKSKILTAEEIDKLLSIFDEQNKSSKMIKVKRQKYEKKTTRLYKIFYLGKIQ